MRQVLKVLPAPLQFVPPTARPPPLSADKQKERCQTCHEEIYGTGYAQAKLSLNHSSNERCAVCKHFICA